MRIQDWSDPVSEEDLAAFQQQFQDGISSIDLSETAIKFLIANSDIQEFGVGNDAERLEAKAIIAVQYGNKALDQVDINLVGIEGVLVGSCAVTGTDEEYNLTNTYHLTKRVHPATEDPVGTQDIAYIVGVILGDMYYFIDEQN